MSVPTATVTDLPADAVILDVREAWEWDAGHVEGALHVPMNDVPAALADDPDTLGLTGRVYIICAVGGRSGQVAAWLGGQGYDVVNVAGGMHAWEDAGRPMISETGEAPTVV